MVYEARYRQRFNIVLAVLCALLSILGFFVNGVIPSASTTNHGAYPLTGWLIVAACFGMAAIFLKRAYDPRVHVRADPNGLYLRAYSDRTIPWDQFVAARINYVNRQAILGLELKEPAAYPSTNPLTRMTASLNRATGFGHVGINASYLTGGTQGVVDAVAHFRPDLFRIRAPS